MVAAGIRRIEAYTGLKALHYLQDQALITTDLSQMLTVSEAKLTSRVEKLLADYQQSLKQNELYLNQTIAKELSEKLTQQKTDPEFAFLWVKLTAEQSFKQYLAAAKGVFTHGLSVLWQKNSAKSGILGLVVGSKSPPYLDAQAIFKAIAIAHQARGGGGRNLAQGSCPSLSDKTLKQFIHQQIAKLRG